MKMCMCMDVEGVYVYGWTSKLSEKICYVVMHTHIHTYMQAKGRRDVNRTAKTHANSRSGARKPAIHPYIHTYIHTCRPKEGETPIARLKRMQIVEVERENLPWVKLQDFDGWVRVTGGVRDREIFMVKLGKALGFDSTEMEKKWGKAPG